jgi:hypothetical protein
MPKALERSLQPIHLYYCWWWKWEHFGNLVRGRNIGIRAGKKNVSKMFPLVIMENLTVNMGKTEHVFNNQTNP